eukprot:239368_1
MTFMVILWQHHSIFMEHMKGENYKSISTKSRIIDVSTYTKLQSPFEFKLQKEDIIAAFRYADVNQDNAISFTDFTQSLAKVGVVKDDDDARETWLNLDKFGRELKEYNKILHNWLCRIVSCDHLARQPFKTDPDQRKLTWKERTDALHSVPRLLDHLDDPHLALLIERILSKIPSNAPSDSTNMHMPSKTPTNNPSVTLCGKAYAK